MRESHRPRTCQSPVLLGLVVALTLLVPVSDASARAAYPVSLVNRPLTLPSGMLELGTDLHFDFGSGAGFGDIVGLNLDLASGAGFGEFFFGVDLHLEGGNTLHDLRGGLSGRITNNVALRWDSGIRNLTGRLTTDWRNSVQLRFKKRLTPRVALVGGGGFLVNWVLIRDVGDVMQLFFLADVGPDVALTPNLSLAARVELALGVSQSGPFRPGNGLAADLRLVYAFSAAFDIFAGLRIGDDNTGLHTDHRLLFGVAGRL